MLPVRIRFLRRLPPQRPKNRPHSDMTAKTVTLLFLEI